MKLIITALVLAQFSASLAFSQAAQKVGNWSIYSSSNGAHKRAETLIQLTAAEQYVNNKGHLVEAQMDAVCTKGKLVALALDTNSIIPKSDLNENGSVDTTLVSYEAGSDALQTEAWVILDHGRTLSPYAEILQERRNREWADRIAHSDKIVLHFDGSDAGRRVTATFQTEGFAQALSAAGCGY